MLAAVADGLAGRVYVTGQCRFRDDAPLPYDVQEVVFADDVLPILHEIEQQVEDLGPYRDPVGAACEFPSFRVESIRSEERRVGKECVSTCRSRWSPYH